MASTYKGYVGYEDPERARVERARQLAETLQGGISTGPTDIWGGLSRLGQAFIAKGAADKADKAESAYADSRKKATDLFLSQQYPDAQGIAQNQLGQNASFDLTPGAMEQRQTQGGQADKVRSLAQLLGGDIMGAMQINEQMKPEPVKPLVVNDKLVDPNNYSVLFDGTTPKEAPLPSYDTVTLDDGVYAVNQNDPTKRIKLGAAPSKMEGFGGLTPYQGVQTQMRLDDLDRELAASNEKARASLATLDGSIALLDKFTGDTDKFNATYGNAMNPTGKKDDLFNWSIAMDDNRKDGMAMLNQLGGQAFIDSIREMKAAGGAGSLSDAEGSKLAVAATRLMEVNQTDEAAKEAADEFRLRLLTFRDALAKDTAAKQEAEVRRRQQMQAMLGMKPDVYQPAQPQDSGQPNLIDQATKFLGALGQRVFPGLTPNQAQPGRAQPQMQKPAMSQAEMDELEQLREWKKAGGR